MASYLMERLDGTRFVACSKHRRTAACVEIWPLMVERPCELCERARERASMRPLDEQEGAAVVARLTCKGAA